MLTRDLERENFLKKNGWENAQRVLLAADASFRHYDRLFKDNQTIILMDAPKSENPEQFVLIDKILQKSSVCVPKVYATDYKNGFVLLEDFGDNTFTKLIQNGFSESELYQKAVNTLIEMQKNVPTDLSILPPYDLEKMLFEVSLLPLWFIKYVVGTDLSEQALSDFNQIWEKIIQKIQSVDKTLVLLDYHVDNLMITPDNQCGVLDFQDARLGPVFYDLVSLIEDARRPVPLEIQKSVTQTYLKAFPEYQTLYPELAPLIAAQRHTKVIGIFVRLCVRDGKPRYLKYIPFVWGLLEKHLAHPDMITFKKWLDQYVPENFRKEVPQIHE